MKRPIEALCVGAHDCSRTTDQGFGRTHVRLYGNEMPQPHRYRTASAVFALLQQRHIDPDDQELRLDED